MKVFVEYVEKFNRLMIRLLKAITWGSKPWKRGNVTLEISLHAQGLTTRGGTVQICEAASMYLGCSKCK